MKHGFFGYGHLAKAIHNGLSSTEESIFVAYSHSQNDKDIKYMNSLEEMISGIDVLWLCIKPQDMQECLTQLSLVDLTGIFVISPVVGYSIASIEKIIGEKNHISRIMPNIGAKYGKGLIAYKSNSTRDQNIREILQNLGIIIELTEDKFNEFTALFGSGPGFLLEILGIWYERSIRLGMNEKESMQALSIFLESISLYIDDNICSSPEELVEKIATKGGTTEAGIHTYKDLLIKNYLNLSIDSAIHRVNNLNNHVHL